MGNHGRLAQDARHRAAWTLTLRNGVAREFARARSPQRCALSQRGPPSFSRCCADASVLWTRSVAHDDVAGAAARDSAAFELAARIVVAAGYARSIVGAAQVIAVVGADAIDLAFAAAAAGLAVVGSDAAHSAQRARAAIHFAVVRTAAGGVAGRSRSTVAPVVEQLYGRIRAVVLPGDGARPLVARCAAVLSIERLRRFTAAHQGNSSSSRRACVLNIVVLGARGPAQDARHGKRPR